VRLRNIHEFVLDCIASLDWVNGRCIIDFSSTSMKHTDGLVGVFLFTIVGICSAEAVLLCFVTEFLKGWVCRYTPVQVFDFVPWCQKSKVLWRTDDKMDAELEIGFKLFVERYISHVELAYPKLVKVFL
jgi:hypothetical protein